MSTACKSCPQSTEVLQFLEISGLNKTNNLPFASVRDFFSPHFLYFWSLSSYFEFPQTTCTGYFLYKECLLPTTTTPIGSFQSWVKNHILERLSKLPLLQIQPYPSVIPFASNPSFAAIACITIWNDFPISVSNWYDLLLQLHVKLSHSAEFKSELALASTCHRSGKIVPFLELQEFQTHCPIISGICSP